MYEALQAAKEKSWYTYGYNKRYNESRNSVNEISYSDQMKNLALTSQIESRASKKRQMGEKDI